MVCSYDGPVLMKTHMLKALCSLQTVQERWKPEKGSGERRQEASQILSRGTSHGVCLHQHLQSRWLVEIACVL